MPVEQIEKPKNKFCFVKKLNFCSRKTQPELNYESIPYQKQMNSPIRIQIEQNRIKLERLNILKKQTTTGRLVVSNSFVDKQMPDFQSTQLEPSGEFYYLNVTNKITSTVLQHSNSSILSKETDPSLSQISECSTLSNSSSSSAFSNSQYDSPQAKRTIKSSLLTNDSSSFTSNSLFEKYQDFSSSFSSQEFQSVNPSFFEPTESNVYVCCKPFVAQIEGDMSLEYTDRVLVLHETDRVFLVKNLMTSICGYVPKQNLIKLEIFLSNF